ncbi:BPSS1780 family membrane protein [Andreprevotia chitinilytica]|uniref:BPSS1780 family membrane protein n=1 Tax=Andreprevotia chitinilytica TaxID=396808 RepID=UPI00068F1FDC|nr:BPSS1780 family membrane protein [Andreprevotia chitinilytica]
MQTDDVIIDVGLEPRSVAPSHAWLWFTEAFAVFRKQPVFWIALAVVFLLVSWMSMLVPQVLGVLLSLLYPTITGAVCLIAARVHETGQPQLATLIPNVTPVIRPLLMVGSCGLLWAVLASLIMLAFGGSDDALVIKAGEALTDEQITQLRNQLLINIVLMAPMLAASYFAPPLILFQRCGVVEAFKLSFTAVLRNWVTVSLAIVLTVCGFALSALTLFIAVLVLMPVLLITQYTAYRDLFESPLPPQETA